MSGSRVFTSGVGTAIDTASISAIRPGSLVVAKIPARTSASTSDGETSWMCDRPAFSRIDHAATDVVADNSEAGSRKLDRQRQADVSEPHHAHDRCVLLDAVEETLLVLGGHGAGF